MPLIKESGAKDDTAVSMDFGQAQAALATGKYQVVDTGGEPGPEIHHGVMGEDPALPGGEETVKAEPKKAEPDSPKAAALKGK